MSDLESKLAPAEITTTTRARATLTALLKRWGSPADLNPKKPPALVMVESMDTREFWSRLGGTGVDSIYELIETQPI